MKKPPQKKLLQTFTKSGYTLLLILLGSLAIHFTVMGLDYFIIRQPLNVSPGNDFIQSIFSLALLPVLIAYALLLFLAINAWRNMKEAMIQAHEKDLEKERNTAVLNTAQQLTATIVAHLANHNAKIMGWVERRRLNNQKVPPEIEDASSQIAESLRMLTEVTFVLPYSGQDNGVNYDYQAILKKCIHDIENSKYKPAEVDNDFFNDDDWE